ncbi:DNA/RNA helicase domain-containing protein [Myroides sp. N17-2]|uniref:DNA/RNA helicase domain-containing protein n=1 Tax=Myroides sp. N17-2 TaxID=2030799 RepID=UPI000EFA67AA|nr:DNA/RNA helicase domain-containing protein [Myroides sp. N17-2]
MEKAFEIIQLDFKKDQLIELELLATNALSWPLVYILNEDKEKVAYIGETTDVIARMTNHLSNTEKNRMSVARFITSHYFNKSATLDIESNLIRYVAADGQFKLINGNLGIANHQYYQQQEVYWDLFKDIWSELRSLGVVRHSLEYIDNSDLFKYSPYKSLSKEQVLGLKRILECILDKDAKVSLIEGGAGTGKSILAIFLFKLLKTDLSNFNYSDFKETDDEIFTLVNQIKEKYKDLKMGLVIPMSSFRKTISNVFKNIPGLSAKMVIGPAEIANNEYDILIIDESHRLRRRVNLGAYFGVFDTNCRTLGLDRETSSELEWAVLKSEKLVLFYDEKQSIKPSDVLKEDFDKLKNAPYSRKEVLRSQFRVKGGRQYVEFIDHLLDLNFKNLKEYKSNEYEVFVFEDLDLMVKQIQEKESSYGLSRMVAGFAWDWISKNDRTKYDIAIGDSLLQWNSVAVDWVNSPNSINEVGCIHTIQGYDLNYVGVIIGPEIGYDPINKCILIKKELYKDKNGKQSIKDIDTLRNYIINIYKTLLLRGIRGTYMYVCDEDLRAYFQEFLPTKEARKEVDALVIHQEQISTQCIPYYDLEIAAGSFSERQSVEEVSYIEMEEYFKNTGEYFACKVVGDSMNKVIPNGAIALFRKEMGGSRNGLICLVESTDIQDSDLGGNYTIKEYESKKTYDEDNWEHSEIILKPLSTDVSYEAMCLRDEETTLLRVIGVFVRVLG